MNNHSNIINDLMKRVYSAVHYCNNPSDAEILETMLSDLDDVESECISDYDNGYTNECGLKKRIAECENLKAEVLAVLESTEK